MEEKSKRTARIQGGVDQSSVRVLYSEDGRWLFVSSGCSMKVYSTLSHELVHVLSRHSADITACSINPVNSLQLLTASLDGRIILWDYLDGSFLREVEFGVPLFKFSIRPGKKEPKLFIEIEKSTMEVDSNEGIELGSPADADKVIVGLRSETVLVREQTTPPAIQLSQATEYLHLGSVASEFCFSYNGEFVVSYVGRSLLVCNILKNRQRSFPTQYALTAVASNPNEMCVATGNERGEVEIWWQWNHRKVPPATSVLHWHAHAVADICFTSDGTFLLSGGEEGVLVVWQLAIQQKHFRPRLGSQITRVACAPADQTFAVSLQNNIIQVVCGLNNNVEWTVGGLRRAHTQIPEQSGMRIGLVLDPRSSSIMANGNPGTLQWYKPDLDQVTSQLDVTGLNYVSRREEPLVLMTVEHAAFSSDGLWLATVEWRDDGKTSPELRLKFWQFSSTSQKFELNTCVDPPHREKVTSLSFQPPPPQSRSISLKSKLTGTHPPLLAVSTSEDGKFKIWVLVRGGGGGGGEKTVDSWACRSVGYYQSMPCRGACFSSDGSLLATNYRKCVNLWDPYTCDLRRVFSSPYTSETFTQIAFGTKSSSHYLLSVTNHHLIVWDLLRCSVLWSVSADVSLLVVDPVCPTVAAFLSPKQSLTHLYEFDPSTPVPVNVLECVCEDSVTSATYFPHNGTKTGGIRGGGGGGGGRESSALYFLTSSQVLYKVQTKGEENPESQKLSDGGITATALKQQGQAFSEVFGDMKKTFSGVEELKRVNVDVHHSLRSRKGLKMWDAAPHSLPPPSSLAPLFLASLLPSTHNRDEDVKGKLIEQDDEEEEDEDRERQPVANGDSDTETEDELVGGTGGSQRDKEERTNSKPVPMDTDNDTTLLPVGFNVPNFDWLTTQHFSE